VHASRVVSQTKTNTLLPFAGKEVGMRSESESEESASPWWESPSEIRGGGTIDRSGAYSERRKIRVKACPLGPERR